MGTEQETLANTELNDADLFNGSVADEAPAETPVAEPEKPVAEQPASGDQPRNPDGTFATKADEKPAPVVPAAPAVADDQDKGGQIPSWRLREETEAKRRLEADLATERTARAKESAAFADMQRQLAQLQKPPPLTAEDVPDPLLDPKGFTDFIRKEYRAEQTNTVRNMQMERAHEKHGEVFEKAYGEAQQAMAQGDAVLQARMNRSANAGEELVKWYRERQTMQEVGTDPNAWLEKKLEERMKDPAFLAKAIDAAKAAANGASPTIQPNGAAPIVRLPPSLSGAARADAHSSLEDNDVSDEGLFRHALR